ncbi:hypothetical protein IE4872_CH02422 [Rhizobium gallicum]|uniref:Uncharacterized protein n=1 Tax=Rhizobium gallicum TaxID=56730 RepID=A0A1L5NJE9_9HYPH|nr:hypothetical protein [Rhizobium gallicum]APO68036.1 hypothetical protein IE4872_CH02422 [Rhizobium gallicum]
MAEDISGEIRLLLEQLVDRFVVKGGKAPDVIESMQRELDEMKLAYEQDPDPADDSAVLEEPSNDWPGA